MWHIFASKRIADGLRWQQIHRHLHARRIEFKLYVSTTAAEHDARVVEAIRSGATHFVPAGGDGATQMLVNALMQHHSEQQPTIALMPLGSGCDLARSFSPYHDAMEWTKCLELPNLASKETLPTQVQEHEMDIGVAKGDWGTRYFVNVASIGLTASIVRRATRLTWLGAIRYLAAFWLVLPTYTRTSFQWTNDNVRLQTFSTLGVVANGRFFGGGFQVAPQAKLDDSMLELLIASATRIQMVSVLYQLWRCIHLRSPYVTSERISVSSVVCDPPADVEADGEYLGTTPVEFSVKPKAIRIVSPNSF